MARAWRNKKSFRVKFSLISIILLILLSLAFVFIENKLRPTIKEIALSQANLTATEIINRVIYDKVLGHTEYNDLVYINKDNEDKVTFIQANTIQISRLIAKVNLEIKKEFEKLPDENFNIPLGQALGSELFANCGPKINIKVVPIGKMDVQLLQDFYEAGINQTRHILYLDVKTSIKIAIPMLYDTENVNVKAPIAETIIVGSVPNTVVKFDTPDNLLKSSLYSGLRTDVK